MINTRNILEEQKRELKAIELEIERINDELSHLIISEDFTIRSNAFTNLSLLDELNKSRKKLIQDILVTLSQIKRMANIA